MDKERKSENKGKDKVIVNCQDKVELVMSLDIKVFNCFIVDFQHGRFESLAISPTKRDQTCGILGGHAHSYSGVLL